MFTNLLESQVSKLPQDLVDRMRATNTAAIKPTEQEAIALNAEIMSHLTYEEYLKFQFRDLLGGKMNLSDKFTSWMDGPGVDFAMLNGISIGMGLLLNYAAMGSFRELVVIAVLTRRSTFDLRF